MTDNERIAQLEARVEYLNQAVSGLVVLCTDQAERIKRLEFKIEATDTTVDVFAARQEAEKARDLALLALTR